MSDIFVFLDDVQYSNQGMHNYHYLKTPQGAFRLKVPVKYNFGDRINNVYTREELSWRDKHLKTIESNYKNSPFFDGIFNDIQMLLKKGETNLSLQNEYIVKNICERFGIRTKTISSSELSIKLQGEEKIIEICKTLGASEYLSGTGARSYQDESDFKKHGINLKYSEYIPFRYPQQWGDFISNVSVIDFLMNCGYNWNLVIKNQKQ